MRVVAVGADHLAFSDRVVRRLEAVGALLGMAGEADLRLHRAVPHRIADGMRIMAARAGNVVARVLAALPVHAQARLMAAEAHPVALLDRRCLGTGEYDGRRVAWVGQMLRAWAVAALAAMLGERRMRIALHRMR